MKSKLTLIVAALIALYLVACENGQNEEPVKAVAVAVHDGYNATLAEGIQFSEKPNYPSFIKSVAGMSAYEPEGRWTEGRDVIFTFAQNLPANFTLELDLAPAFGPNIGKEIQIQVGDWKGQFVGLANPITNKFLVKTSTPTDSIEFTIPAPKSPKSLGDKSLDPRQLGIAFKRLSIVAN